MMPRCLRLLLVVGARVLALGRNERKHEKSSGTSTKAWSTYRGGGTGPAGPVLAGPLFWNPSPMTRECREGSLIYQSEIAASGI